MNIKFRGSTAAIHETHRKLTFGVSNFTHKVQLSYINFGRYINSHAVSLSPSPLFHPPPFFFGRGGGIFKGGVNPRKPHLDSSHFFI